MLVLALSGSGGARPALLAVEHSGHNVRKSSGWPV